MAILATTNTVHSFGYVFLGWVTGGRMAAIARVVYPAPSRTLLTRERRGQVSGG